jgi:hypothetical protein
MPYPKKTPKTQRALSLVRSFLGRRTKTGRTKNFKERVVGNLTIEPLIRGITREKRCGHPIQKIGCSENSFSPKSRRNRR